MLISINDALVAMTCLLVSLAVIEYTAVRTQIPGSVMRKIAHVGMALIVATLCFLFSYKIFIGIGLTFTIIMLILRFAYPLKSLSDRANHSYGEVLFPLGIGVCAFIASDALSFIICIGVLGIADTAAFYAGRLIPSKKIINNKTRAGTCAFLLVAVLLSLPLLSITHAAILGAVLAAIELLSPKGSDNFTIPVAGAVLLVFL